MVDAIDELLTLPEEALTITGNGAYRFAFNGWNWLIDKYGDKIVTKDITNPSHMFKESKELKNVPFNINTSYITSISNMFYQSGLVEVPYVIGIEKELPLSAYSGTMTLDNVFAYCTNLRYIPEDFFRKLIPNIEYWNKNAELTTQSHAYMFHNCYSLRELPDISMLGGAWTSAYSAIYKHMTNGCYSLNKIVNMPVGGKYTSNVFNGSFDNCYRLKEFTFAVNEDGTPKTAEWKSQLINTKMFGYVVSTNEASWLKNYNHGITADKKVTDDATYQVLKNDEDYYTCNPKYSLYNHDAAVRTINSLPDCSATGVNSIQFQGEYGELTDGGAINTLTEEEIAVATAKGWTVSLV